MPAKDNTVHRPSGNGTTHKIREQLNFLDNKKWKQFSSRRLELIDKFGLHEKKASEQDINIKRIASILRTEFNYPIDFQLDFEKLVTAAVQSVRRNRKRSIKTRHLNTGSPSDSSTPNTTNTTGNGTNSGSDSEYENDFSASVKEEEEKEEKEKEKGTQETNSVQPHVFQPKPVRMVSPVSCLDTPTTMTTNTNTTTMSSRSGTPNGSTSTIKVNSKYSAKPVMRQQPILTSVEIVKQIIADMVHLRVPIREQEKKDSVAYYSNNNNNNNNNNSHSAGVLPPMGLGSPGASSPSLEFFALTSHNRDLLPLALKQQQPQQQSQQSQLGGSGYCIPFFLKEKTLSQINRSKTCLEISSQQGSFIDLYPNVLLLGNTVLQAAVSFVIERFYSAIPTSSKEYLMGKLIHNNNEVVALLAVQFFNNATQHNVETLPPVYQIYLFKIIFGSLCKDFGFDPVIYPLSEIFNDYIVKEFPLVVSSSSSLSSSSLSSSSSFSATASGKNSNTPLVHRIHTPQMIMNTVSMKPATANQDIYRKVVINYKEKSQEFTFHLLSNGPPTIVEIINNCKKLFSINPLASLQLFHNIEHEKKSLLIKDDMELATIFNQFSFNKTFIEIKELSQIQIQTQTPTPMAAALSPVPMVKSEGFSADIANGLSILSTAATSVNYTQGEQHHVTMPQSKSPLSQMLLSHQGSPLSFNSPLGATTPSAASTISKSIVTSTSNTPLDSRPVSPPPRTTLNSPPPEIKKCKGLFLNNNLPQPVNEFQPLLQ